MRRDRSIASSDPENIKAGEQRVDDADGCFVKHRGALWDNAGVTSSLRWCYGGFSSRDVLSRAKFRAYVLKAGLVRRGGLQDASHKGLAH